MRAEAVVRAVDRGVRGGALRVDLHPANGIADEGPFALEYGRPRARGRGRELADAVVMADDEDALRRRLAISRRRRMTSRPIVESRLAVGSSARTGRARWRARERWRRAASLRRRASPAGSRAVGEAEFLEQRVARSCALGAADAGDVERDLDVLAGGERGHQVEVLEDEADRWARSAGSSRSVSSGEVADEAHLAVASGGAARRASRAASSCRCRTGP